MKTKAIIVGAIFSCAAQGAMLDLQPQIDAAAAKGGGTVCVPAGEVVHGGGDCAGVALLLTIVAWHSMRPFWMSCATHFPFTVVFEMSPRTV